MKNILSKLTALILSVTLIFSYTVVFAEDVSDEDIQAYWAEAVTDAMTLFIMNNYKFGAETGDLYKSALEQVIKQHPEVLESAMQGMFESLDEYSTYFTEEEFKSFVEDVSGEFCGIGVTIMEFSDGLMVTEVHKGSAAEIAGLKKGDVIISADGTDIRGMEIELARTYIVGPVGTSVTVGIMRDGQHLTFDMVRSVVTTVAGFYQILDGNIGYLQLSSFDEHAHEFMAEALDALKDTKNIILDLRYNPGGSLETLKAIASMTLPKGPVMHLEYKFSIDNTTIMNEVDGFKNKLVVLVNGYTASAAEAFAAAVQDYGIGVVVGEQTIGKGTMQTVGGILTGGGYKLTVAEYLSPNKRTINGIGVEPDYYVAPRTVAYSDDYFEPITYDRVMRIGDTGADVLALEQRLNVMGYSVGVPDTEYDEDTFYAVKKYQESAGLYPYGVLDITTQLSIHSYLQDKEITLDKAYDKAVEIASGDIDEYIKEAIANRE